MTASRGDSDGGGLGQRMVGGAVWLGLAQSVRFVLTFGSTIVLARILSPMDFGIMAMVLPLFALVGMLRDFGLTAVTIQAATLSYAQANSLFWANVFLSVLLAALVLASAPLVGWFYHDLRAAQVTAAGALLMLIGGLAVQHSALLDRAMRFRSLAKVEIGSLVTTYATTLVLAIQLQSFWALFLGNLVGSVAQTALTWRASTFQPGRPSLSGIRSMVKVGGHVTGANLTSFLSRNLDTVLVARFSGASDAGIYDRSYKLLLLPLGLLAGPLNRLLQPILRDLWPDPAQFRRTYMVAMHALCLLLAPGVAISAALSEPLMLWLLGGQWVSAGQVYFWLALAGVLQPVSNSVYVLFMASERSEHFLRIGVLSATVMVVAFVLAAKFGVVMMAFAYFAASSLLLPIRFAHAVRGTPLRVRDLYAVQFMPLIGVIPVSVAAWVLQDRLPFIPLMLGATLLAYVLALASTSLTAEGRANNLVLVRTLSHHPLRALRRRMSSAG